LSPWRRVPANTRRGGEPVHRIRPRVWEAEEGAPWPGQPRGGPAVPGCPAPGSAGAVAERARGAVSVAYVL